MDKLVIRKLPRELVYSIPVINIEEPEDPEEFPNWIVEDENEENQEFLNWIVENFLDEDTGSEKEENVELNLRVGCIFECRQQIAMRYNRNVSLDDMKGRINAKIVSRCGRRISKLFYKFPVSTNPIKFTEMELVDNEDMETMIALYWGNGSDRNAPIHLFAELAGMEQNKYLTAHDEEHRAQEPCMVALISYIDSESTIRGIDIDLNVTPDIDVVGDDGYESSDPCDQEVDSDSDLDIDDVPDDIDDEDVNDDGNINASSVGNQMRRIVIHNNLGPHMSLINPDAAHVAEFPEYPEILLAH
ncbi:hypothetical protein PVK06_047177 [Gossypium arboreum]|uniref:Uncharacterized protein n=1 Tax=Gossypium arboreum TaxID=29729 RepID=A0ABR0MD04_GOSAR|nr:hypothetical protein PVK06_047177 [Gossypium arboreum]